MRRVYKLWEIIIYLVKDKLSVIRIFYMLILWVFMIPESLPCMNCSLFPSLGYRSIQLGWASGWFQRSHTGLGPPLLFHGQWRVWNLILADLSFLLPIKYVIWIIMNKGVGCWEHVKQLEPVFILAPKNTQNHRPLADFSITDDCNISCTFQVIKA